MFSKVSQVTVAFWNNFNNILVEAMEAQCDFLWTDEGALYLYPYIDSDVRAGSMEIIHSSCRQQRVIQRQDGKTGRRRSTT